MILYNASSSYYSMIARLALLEAGVPFESRRMDIHIAQEQLSPWYIAINPARTVPALTDGNKSWTDSRDILKFAAVSAEDRWLDAEPAHSPQIEQIVQAHYLIPIERLTFGKALVRIPPLRFIFPRILRSVSRKLEVELQQSQNPKAIQAKLDTERQRLAYFGEGNRIDKLQLEREKVRDFIKKLPIPGLFLLGDKPSSADIVTIVLLGRLQMIGEYNLVPPSSPLDSWFERMQARAAYKEADIWTHFQLLRILMKR